MTGTVPRRARTAPAAPAAPADPTEDRLVRLVADAVDRTPGVYAPTMVTVRAHGHVARVDLDLVVGYGRHLATVAEAVRRGVAARIEAHSGLSVHSVTVTVVDVLLEGEEPR